MATAINRMPDALPVANGAAAVPGSTISMRVSSTPSRRSCAAVAPLVTMMRLMGIPVQAIGIPDRQRERAKQLVKPGKTRGMPVDQLMLQGHVPGGKPDKQQRGGQQAERLPERQRGKPASVNRQDQQPCGQFASPQKS